ncbi:MAG: hypothetical protein BA871_11780 [Desulfuromonadales bacterium C00003096]|nr:MAG: hypothetical protein BA871_11780 [Desulfuromonadales bacterium C00003096]
MQITDRDWAQLSAYLDGELSGRELRQVRKKIQTDPLLQAALEQLKITKQILQTAPRIPAPRNFTLTPEMIGVKSRKPSFSRFRLAAALMSFLLIGVMILDFGGIYYTGAMSAEFSPKSIEAQLESIPEIAADAVQEPVLLEAVGEVPEDQAVAEYEEDSTNVGAPAIEAEAVEETPAEGVAEKGQEEEPQDTDAATGTNRAQGGEEPQSTVQVLPSQTPETPPAVVEYFPEGEIHGPERSDGISTLRILEILFGLGVVGFSVAAWTKRRKFH